MREANSNKQLLIEYLLGSLPGEQVELFDELSIADDEFAKSLAAAEDDLVDAYVRGELTGSELTNFRSSYLTSADKYEKVRFAQSLQTFCERSAVNSVSATPPAAASRDKFSFLNIFKIPRVKWVFTAAIVLLIAFAWFAYHNLRVRQHSEGRIDTEASRNNEKRNEVAANAGQSPPQAEEREASKREVSKETKELTKTEPTPKNQKPSREGDIAALVLTPQMRGIGQFSTFRLPAKTDVVAVQLQLEPNDYSIYRVELQNESSQVLWRSSKVSAKGTTLRLNFPAKLLTPQVFVLQLYGVDANKSETLSAYPFKVVQ
jgi:hypothetical protein